MIITKTLIMPVKLLVDVVFTVWREFSRLSACSRFKGTLWASSCPSFRTPQGSRSNNREISRSKSNGLGGGPKRLSLPLKFEKPNGVRKANTAIDEARRVLNKFHS
jgi:hypothetical protein